MERTLLATSTRIPPLAPHLVPRPHLIAALDQAITGGRLVTLAAPAGYGKTMLLAEWAHSSNSAVAWFSIDETDNDFDRFFRYLLAAWERVRPEIGQSPLGLLLGSVAPPADAVLAAFINVASDAGEAVVFVLDDAHLIVDPEIYRGLAFLIEHAPRTLHVAIAGREVIPLPMARYRARRHVREFGHDDLRWSNDEATQLLNERLALGLTEAQIETVQASVEGWVAGLHLVALSRPAQPDAADPPIIGGRHRFIADFLRDEVLARVSGDVRDFLMRTAVLERLSGSLCDAVTGHDGGQAMLERLEQANLFVVPLEDNREWFRYHRLFADVLREELLRQAPADLAGLHRRAAQWFLDRDLPDEALNHAVAGDDPDLAMAVGERHFEVKLLGGEFTTLRRWLDSLPPAWQIDYPLVGLMRAGLCLFTGAFEDGVRHLDRVERHLAGAERPGKREGLARVAAIRCTVACFHNDLPLAEAHASLALRDLRADDHVFRAAIHHALGDTYRGHGRWEEAKARYLSGLDLVQEPAYQIRSAHAHGALADLALRQGRLRESAQHWRRAIAAIENRATWGTLPLPLTGWVFIRMSEIHYEWNELAAAKEMLARGLERSALGGDVRALLAGALAGGRIALTEGDLVAATALMERAHQLVERTHFTEWTDRCERFQFECWLAQGQLGTALARVESLPVGDGPERAIVDLAVARVLIASGGRSLRERALRLLDGVIAAAEGDGRIGIQIEGLTLRALARWNDGDRAGAMIPLEQALRLAEPEGYLRRLADVGIPIVWLLREARTRGLRTSAVDRLLSACASAGPEPIASLPEPLSARELDVLRLLAAGLANREIAERLGIAAETVKKHAASIYGKLGVGNRTAAVSRATALSLLDDRPVTTAH